MRPQAPSHNVFTFALWLTPGKSLHQSWPKFPHLSTEKAGLTKTLGFPLALILYDFYDERYLRLKVDSSSLYRWP